MRPSPCEQFDCREPKQRHLASAAGFTLMETCFALLIMLVVSLGAASLFTIAAGNNSGAGDRQLAMAVAQDRMERMRNVIFTDPLLNATPVGGTVDTVVSAGRTYQITTFITASNPVNALPTIKTITIRVRPIGAGPSWSAATSIFSSVTVVSQRSSILTGTRREL